MIQKSCRITEGLDDGSLFHRGFFLCLVACGVLFVLAESFLLVAGLFGEKGYFPTLKALFDDSAFFALRSIIASLLTLAVSAAGLAAMLWITWKRASDIRKSEYQGITVIVTRVIKLVGELAAIVPVVVSTNIFLGLIFLTGPYGHPFGRLPKLVYQPLVQPFLSVLKITHDIGLGGRVGSFGEYLLSCLLGGVLTLLAGLLVAFVIVVGCYWLAELVGIVHGFLIHRPLFARESKD